MERKLTCIVCPLGCELVAQIEDGAVSAVSGNKCPRGKAYAEQECLHPRRTVTTTVRCRDGGLVSVKTATPIAKERIAECMRLLNTIVAPLPIAVGDVIAENVCGSTVVATQNRG